MTRLESTFPKIERYIKMFEWEIRMLGSPKEKHILTDQNLCDKFFHQWGKYDEENPTLETPNSPEI
jgi:hypothetical protein